MKNSFIIMTCSALLLSGCGTYTGSGAMTGASFGSILGSAIGGISDGPRGSDIGTIIGMAGGAVLGAAVGSQADQAQAAAVHDHYDRVQQQKERDRAYSQQPSPYARQQPQYSQPYGSSQDDSGFDSTNSGDDRIYDFGGSDYTGNYSAAVPTIKIPSGSSVEKLGDSYTYTPNIELRGARFVDDNEDGVLSRGEMGKIIFEVMNRGSQTLYDVQPSVIETTGNRHIWISPGIHVESIEPGRGIRYTAIVKADGRLKNGTARFALTVLQGKKSISKVTEFAIATRR